ncbi:hypothetical protein BDZ85DRAFT_27384 [Elsinoe ampelina]|uniref:DUF4419 domain-containing protein n=1 Tax=Elsinoe ampelina TaxID=302913 RepID=A0A6A6G4F9_9PEZI|nr:hypothetical protein BDZ85DRAFT_27384 [Elsinoe ampelina]
MPVTLNIASHGAEAFKSYFVHTAEELFAGSCERYQTNSSGLIQTSVSQSFLDHNNVSSSTNGFVWAAFQAYSNHHHLVIRPEDVWFAILSQLCFYINAHAEELRHIFVSHEGRKEVEVKAFGTINTVDLGDLAFRMGEALETLVKDPELRSWMMPSFTTTTDTDRIVASILMMGSLQKYFSYLFTLTCGIPSVTLLGEREYWEKILRRLDKLPTFGTEPERFGTLLRPVLKRFVASFDAEPSVDVHDFWTKIAHMTGGSGPYYLSGWLTAFCFWDNDGNLLYRDPQRPVSHREFEGSLAGCELDHTLYHRIDTDQVPSGYAAVPVTVNDNGQIHRTEMVAGSLGILATSGCNDAIQGDSSRKGDTLDTLQSLSGWLMYKVENTDAGQAGTGGPDSDTVGPNDSNEMDIDIEPSTMRDEL